MDASVASIGLASYGLGAAAFLGLTLFSLINGRRELEARLFVAASAMTTLWLTVVAVQFATGFDLSRTVGILEQLRSIAWLVFLARLLGVGSDEPLSRDGRRRVAIGVAAAVAIVGYEAVRPFSPEVNLTVLQICRLALVVAGFALIENLTRNATRESAWRLKFLCFALGGILAYDLFFYADALLFRRADESLSLARGAVHALVAPLLGIAAARSTMWETRVALSHKSAVYTTALVASGVYLLAMSAAAFYIRVVGGAWGPVIQAVFLFGGIVLLGVILTSGTFRAHLKVLISKHFYHYKYDYREAWMRFMNTVSESREPETLETRVIRGIADAVDSPAGAIWMRLSRRYAVASTLNMAAASVSNEEVATLIDFLEERDWILDLEDVQATPQSYGFTLPPSLAHLQNAWILVPLAHSARVVGFVILAKPRAPRSLDWEDFDLLRLLGRQAGSYLAEQALAGELAETRQFERFSRRTTFVMHDIKNLVSQLSLVSTNMAKHGDNPEFREDMTNVLSEAVGRMHRLMERIRSDQDPRETDQTIAIRPMLEELVASKPGAPVRLTAGPDTERLTVRADDERLRAIFDHILQNAIDAGGDQGWVQLAVSRESGTVVVDITDNGPGMDPTFVRTELFTPFRSTKKSGFGIGAFQCRQYARELGGDVEVVSSPGAGTTMRVTLPTIGPEASISVSSAAERPDGPSDPALAPVSEAQ